MALGAALLQVLALKLLPSSTSEFETISSLDAATAPTAEGFALGGIEWDLAAYRTAPELDAFRSAFGASCAGLTGLHAATCVSNDMASRFQHGPPEVELFDVHYSPVRALSEHSAGRAGHCVTRSGLLAAMLMSVGIPARIIQLIRTDGTGHTVVEVWDERAGWTFFDPSLGLVLRGADTTLSAGDAGEAVTAEPWRIGRTPEGAEHLTSFYGERPQHAFQGTRLYPEPWLYLRTGPRQATWPFRAAFARAGEVRWALGPLQSLLRVGTMIASAVAVLAAVVALSRRAAPRSTLTVTAASSHHRNTRLHEGTDQSESSHA